MTLPSAKLPSPESRQLEDSRKRIVCEHTIGYSPSATVLVASSRGDVDIKDAAVSKLARMTDRLRSEDPAIGTFDLVLSQAQLHVFRIPSGKLTGLQNQYRDPS